MEASLLSSQWFRVAALKPHLRPQVSVARQQARGQLWYVLHNEASGRFHRVNERAYEVVGRLDGELTVDGLWRELVQQQGDEAPSQDDVLRVLGQLAEADLLQAEQMPDLRRQVERAQVREQAQARSRVHPLSFRVKLFDPSPWLQRWGRLARLVFNPVSLWLWIGLLAMGGWVAAQNGPELMAHARSSLSQPRVLLMMWLIYPLLKALHEFGHALALRRWGCATHEVGLTFLLLMPLPHVDATSSLRLPDRWARATIAAAGIMVELGGAAVAVMVWAAVQPGWLRDAALVTLTLGGISTLVFNGNPLMRYDGYHFLCDAAGLPNLAGRSQAHWRQRLTAWTARLLGSPVTDEDDAGGRQDRIERWALWWHAPAAWLWRLTVGTVIVAWLADLSTWLAVAGALWVAWGLLASPIAAWVTDVTSASALAPVQGRARALMLGVVSAALFSALVLPWPATLHADGLVWLPPEAQVRSASPARLQQALVRDGQVVQAGQPLMTLVSDELRAEQAVLRARIAVAEAQRSAAWATDPVGVSQAEEAIARDRSALTEVERRLAGLTIRAGVAGRLVWPDAADMVGRDVAEGEVLARLLPPGGARVLVVVSEADVGLWREALRRRREGAEDLHVMLADARGSAWPAQLVRQVPAALDRLPAPALGSAAGGPIEVDPTDPDGTRPLHPVFTIELLVPQAVAERVGSRAQVRLTLAPQTLVDRVFFRMRQLLLSHMGALG
jgi:putative peptide zinc metalloprotease protein